MRSKSRGRKVRSGSSMFAAFLYYIMLSIATLVGLTAYTAGVGLEGALLRAASVLLICAALACAVNMYLWLAGAQFKLVPADGLGANGAPRAGHGRDQGREIEGRVNYVTTHDAPESAMNAPTEQPIRGDAL